MKKKELYSLGIMSGTSLDGLDFSIIRSDGKKKIKVLFNSNFKIKNEIREDIYKLIKKFNALNFSNVVNSDFYKRINSSFSKLIIKKINIFLKKNKFELSKIDLIGMHGNTLFHKPKEKISLQLGDPILLANQLKKPVVCNFRKNDIFLGGQGAPLVPVFHRLIFSKKNKNIMVVNIGGISNFTLLVGTKRIFASDIGPGNALIDKFCNLKFNKLFDEGGKIAASGDVIYELINEWLKKDFLKMQIPKSFDNYFFKLIDFAGLSKKNPTDLLRTLTFFTAKIIVESQSFLKFRIDEWIFCGGGVMNKTLMRDVKDLLKGKKNTISDEMGFDSDFIESQAFAYIATRTIKNLPSAFPNTTGCRKNNVCGEIVSFL